ncbi:MULTISPECIES: thioredoxin family protein [unclassified Actinopolyspora]|uniref:TlpA family protein disulfide reductase n=1 Tax=unclassified Actinopolyspora TaxID=2639451 RepID=UPI0013F5B60A|nr:MULTISPECIES: thioredoxin family protein [unclassified Actinopolyspora]NHD16373.1 thioredoxin family protein [Actinopolyspora sp. BKK2]NHE75764.1 thioredoxin family protein [Actinopolyspora sp. BKK1]
MSPGWPALVVAVAAGLVLGALLRSREGRVNRTRLDRSGGARGRIPRTRAATNGTDREDEIGREPAVFDQLPPEIADALRGALRGSGRGAQAGGSAADGPPESEVTLLQLSTTFCAPCRHTRVLLSTLVERTAGLRHVEFDLTHHPEWSKPLRVHTTPTTLALDSAGRELFRVSGVPRRDGLDTALRPHLAR